MNSNSYTESDWKLFRKKLPDWQENYMEKLLEEYKTLLSTEAPASTRFWGLDARIKKDKKCTGVLAKDICRSNMPFHMMDLIREGAISMEDLDGFSEEFREMLKAYFD